MDGGPTALNSRSADRRAAAEIVLKRETFFLASEARSCGSLRHPTATSDHTVANSPPCKFFLASRLQKRRSFRRWLLAVSSEDGVSTSQSASLGRKIRRGITALSSTSTPTNCLFYSIALHVRTKSFINSCSQARVVFNTRAARLSRDGRLLWQRRVAVVVRVRVVRQPARRRVKHLLCTAAAHRHRGGAREPCGAVA